MTITFSTIAVSIPKSFAKESPQLKKKGVLDRISNLFVRVILFFRSHFGSDDFINTSLIKFLNVKDIINGIERAKIPENIDVFVKIRANFIRLAHVFNEKRRILANDPPVDRLTIKEMEDITQALEWTESKQNANLTTTRLQTLPQSLTLCREDLNVEAQQNGKIEQLARILSSSHLKMAKNSHLWEIEIKFTPLHEAFYLFRKELENHVSSISRVFHGVHNDKELLQKAHNLEKILNDAVFSDRRCIEREATQ